MGLGLGELSIQTGFLVNSFSGRSGDFSNPFKTDHFTAREVGSQKVTMNQKLFFFDFFGCLEDLFSLCLEFTLFAKGISHS